MDEYRVSAKWTWIRSDTAVILTTDGEEILLPLDSPHIARFRLGERFTVVNPGTDDMWIEPGLVHTPNFGQWWTYPKGQWSGPLVMLGNCEGCRATVAFRLPGHRALVIALWRFRHDPDCTECEVLR